MVNNGRMVMQTDLNMNSKRIESLPNPITASDAANKLYCDNIDHYAAYRKIFPIFYNLLDTTHYNIIQTPTSKQINKINPNLILGTSQAIGDYASGSGLKLNMGTYLQTTDTFNQDSSFTLFISFNHDSTKTCQINWMASLGSVHTRRSYPRYKITNNQITIDASSRGTHTVQFPSYYQNKKLFLWVCFNGSNNTYKMRLGNYSSIATLTVRPPMNFQLNQLELNFDVNVNKIGFSNQFIDVDSLDHYRIMLEEKRNASYVV